MSVTTTLRKAIERTGKTAYRIHKDLDGRVSMNVLYRIMSGETTEREDTLDALCDLLGLELRKKRS